MYSFLEETQTGSLGRVNLNLYVAYSEAFKPPRTPSGLNPPGAEANLDPENITNYEVGLKSSFLDGRASLQATYFQMERDGIVVSTQEGPFFRDSNAGKQDFEGLELGVGGRPRRTSTSMATWPSIETDSASSSSKIQPHQMLY